MPALSASRKYRRDVRTSLKLLVSRELCQELCLTPPVDNGLIPPDWVELQWLKDGTGRRSTVKRAGR
jgi:hypothetical protein